MSSWKRLSMYSRARWLGTVSVTVWPSNPVGTLPSNHTLTLGLSSDKSPALSRASRHTPAAPSSGSGTGPARACAWLTFPWVLWAPWAGAPVSSATPLPELPASGTASPRRLGWAWRWLGSSNPVSIAHLSHPLGYQRPAPPARPGCSECMSRLRGASRGRGLRSTTCHAL